MKRRDFLKYSTLLGLAGVASTGSSLRLFAAEDNYSGPLWITIDARGGWDPTSFCDPKGYSNPTDAARLNNYPTNSILNIGNEFKVAPPPDSFLTDNTLYRADTFFSTYAQRLLVVNGIDVQTNSHADGQRHIWSGELGRQGYPNIGAFIAGVSATSKSLPFITNGGYSVSGNLLTPVRLDSRGTAVMFEIANPNRSNDPDSSNSRLFYSPDVLDLMRQTSVQRTQAQLDAQNLIRVKTAIEKMQVARENGSMISNFSEVLLAGTERPVADFNGRTQAHNVYKQGRIALAAYESGVTAAAHITLGGFDTHSNHDATHYPRLMDLLQGIAGILSEAQQRGLQDRIVVVVGSDFGRTNKYNAGNGKDHWPVTSMMFIGNTTERIRGNRVIGATTSTHRAVKIDPVSLQPDFNESNPNSIRITPAHIHRALRKLANVNTGPTAQRFLLQGQDLDLFS